MKKKFHNNAKEYVDCDYLNKLNEKDCEWMLAFLDFEYNGNPTHLSKLQPLTLEQKRYSYNRKNKIRSDVFRVANNNKGERDV